MSIVGSKKGKLMDAFLFILCWIGLYVAVAWISSIIAKRVGK